MGSGSSKVMTYSEEHMSRRDLLDSRIRKASDDRHQLVLLSLNTNKLHQQSQILKSINDRVLKHADAAVHGRVKYTRKVRREHDDEGMMDHSMKMMTGRK